MLPRSSNATLSMLVSNSRLMSPGQIELYQIVPPIR
jgi:hypothetical protein